MGRTKVRELLGETIIERENATFQLPIKVSTQNGELLYDYSKEILKKALLSLVDALTIKEEVYRNGPFSISFMASCSA
ncbi:MAG: hypothetical protein QXH24_04190 [Candidatus Bathyarchaeia archaeon]